MKPLDEFIRENPERFDTGEPLPGHFGRFDRKLDAFHHKRSRKTVLVLLKVAAAVLFLSVISYASFHEYKLVTGKMQQVLTYASSPELKEAEAYYVRQLDLYYSQLQALNFKNGKAEKQQILDELNDMDKQMMALKEDLRQNPDDERIVSAIINFYQVKIDLMDMIITRTSQTNNALL